MNTEKEKNKNKNLSIQEIIKQSAGINFIDLRKSFGIASIATYYQFPLPKYSKVISLVDGEPKEYCGYKTLEKDNSFTLAKTCIKIPRFNNDGYEKTKEELILCFLRFANKNFKKLSILDKEYSCYIAYVDDFEKSFETPHDSIKSYNSGYIIGICIFVASGEKLFDETMIQR